MTAMRSLLRSAAALLCCVLGTLAVRAQTLTPDERRYRPGRPDLTVNGVEVLPVRGRVHLLATGRASNVVAQVGDNGVFLVDSGTADIAPPLLAALRGLSSGPVRGIVNTTTDLDHIGGNEQVARSGQPMFAGAIGASTAPQAQIFATERALAQISAPTGAAAKVPVALWPTDTFVGARKKFYFNGEPIEIRAVPGHTSGDALVWFRSSDVLAVGDMFSTITYPRVDAVRGGTVESVIAGLNGVVDLAVAEFNQQGGTRIVPSHGRIANQSDVVEYRDMVTIIRDRVRDAIMAGRTLEQITAAKYTLDYDGIYSVDGYTGDQFVQAIYAEMKK
jgi:glyoxylase-like metal-dependent hydrolase (beta-lactamase superfamily II)